MVLETSPAPGAAQAVMAALFSPSSNRVVRGVLLTGAVALVGIPLFLMALVRSPAVTGQYTAPPAPSRSPPGTGRDARR